MRRRYRAQIVEDSASFGNFFEDRVEAIERSAENTYLRGLDSGLRFDFIGVLVKWCEREGLDSLSIKLHTWQSSPHVAMTSVVDELLLLKIEDLLKLTLIHRNVVMGDQEGLTQAFCLPLLSFLSDACSKQQRLCCGQFLFALAHAATCVRELKKGMVDMRPVTLGKIEGILDRVESSGAELLAGDMLKDVLDSIHLMTDPISEFKRSMEEVRRWSMDLQRHKAYFVGRSLESCLKGLKSLGKGVYQTLSAIELWMDIQVGRWVAPLGLKDEVGETMIEIQVIILKRLDEFESLLKNIKVMPTYSLRGIAIFFLETVTRHEDLYRKSIQSGLFRDPAIHNRFKLLMQSMADVKLKLSIVVQQEKSETSLYPDFFKQQLRYFQFEVPEIVMRGNRGELRNLAHLMRHCYDGLSSDKRQSTKIEPKVMKNHYTEVVVNSTALLRPSGRGG